MIEKPDKFIPTWFWGIIVLQVLIVSFSLANWEMSDARMNRPHHTHHTSKHCHNKIY